MARGSGDCPSPHSSCGASTKCDQSGPNTISVKQPGGKDFTILLCPATQGASKPKVTLSKYHGPVSIVIHSGPKNRVTPHPCFNTAADRKSNAVIKAAKDKLSYKIHSPADNLNVKLVGDNLVETLGEPPSYYPPMLLKGGGSGCSPHSRERCGSPESKPQCNNLEVRQSCRSPEGNQCNDGSQNAVKLSMPGSGLRLNIKVGKNDTKVECGSPPDSCSSSQQSSPRSGDRNENRNCNDTDRASRMEKLCRLNYQPTISSLIATRMTQLKREMLMNAAILNAPAPAPPFINF